MKVPLLNFEGGPGSKGPEAPSPGVLVPLLHHALLISPIKLNRASS